MASFYTSKPSIDIKKLKISNSNRNLFFGDTIYVYFHIQFKIFDGGVQLAPCFILSVPEKNYGADN